MSPRLVAAVFLAAAGFLAPGLRADPGGESRVLTESDAVELAVIHSRELASLATGVEIARRRLDSNNAINNPEVRIRDVSTDYIRKGFDDLEVGLRWRPPGLGEFGLKENKARVRVAQGEVRAGRFRDRLVARVRRTYADLVVLEEQVSIARERVETETRRLVLVEGMKDLGRRSIVYYTKARMWLAESRTDLTRLRHRLNQTKRKLARLTGINNAFTVRPDPIPVVKLSEEDLWRLAGANRPEFELVRRRIALALSEYDRERFRLIPWFSFVELSYHVEADRTDWGELVLGIELPLFNFNRGNIRATELAVNRKEDQSSAMTEKLRVQVRDRFAAYQEARLDWDLSSKDTRKLIGEVKGLIGQANKHDTIPPDEVLELELTVLEARRILSQKRKILAHALIDLCLALGVEDPGLLAGEASKP
ncbi:MAG: TolC family protein [Deltaproteobacteria bacterium]|nr:TolC family protein [Deltaproteobacteria bacterium]